VEVWVEYVAKNFTVSGSLIFFSLIACNLPYSDFHKRLSVHNTIFHGYSHKTPAIFIKKMLKALFDAIILVGEENDRCSRFLV